MSRRVDFYTISLHNANGVTDYSIKQFFEDIKKCMFNADESVQIVRRIGEKWIRLFPYYYSISQRQVVIPFGKWKDKNKPYWINENNHLEEIPNDLYDVNCLGYDEDYNVMVFTTNREGPTVTNIEAYLNSFIPQYTGLSVKIDPIMHNSGIEKVRNAGLVRNVTLKLDLGRSLNNFYLNQIEDNQTRSLISAIKYIAETVKDDSDGKTLALTVGLGKHSTKEDSLNLESILYLLENINIAEEFVTEIEVHYKDGRDEKVDVAKLKSSQMLLSYLCKCEETQVSPENLLNNINSAVAERVLMVTRHNRDFFANINEYSGTGFDIVTNWDNDN